MMPRLAKSVVDRGETPIRSASAAGQFAHRFSFLMHDGTTTRALGREEFPRCGASRSRNYLFRRTLNDLAHLL